MRRILVLVAPLAPLAPLALLGGLAGCGSHIGSSCTQSTDCSMQGNRQCDTALSGGYCTIFGCSANTCPDDAACAAFAFGVPGCGYNDYQAEGRAGFTLCMAVCGSNADCRSGYECADPRGAPWYADILDDARGPRICVVPASMADLRAVSVDPEAGVCSATVPFPDASPADAENDASDAAFETGGDSAPMQAGDP